MLTKVLEVHFKSRTSKEVVETEVNAIKRKSQVHPYIVGKTLNLRLESKPSVLFLVFHLSPVISCDS